jgi:hypothetical protein
MRELPSHDESDVSAGHNRLLIRRLRLKRSALPFCQGDHEVLGTELRQGILNIAGEPVGERVTVITGCTGGPWAAITAAARARKPAS